MTMLLPLLMFVIFIVCVAMLFTEGMFGNAVMLINVVTAALLATNFWEPLSRWLEGQLPTFTYFLDFIALWGLFVAFFNILRLATDGLSRVKVRFLGIADRIGSVFFACWVGWVMVCFTMFTLHTAPLARNFLFGGFDPQRRMMVVAPDRQWLGFMQKVSTGAFSRGLSKEEIAAGKYGPPQNQREAKLAVFDAQGEFIPKYATRRANLEAHAEETGKFKVREEDLGSEVKTR